MAYPDPKGHRGQEHARKPTIGSRCQGRCVGRTRTTWRKLDCLNPNLQKMQVHIHRKDTRNRCRSCRGDEKHRGNLQGQERCPVRTFKEMSGAPKSCCTMR